MDGGGRLLRSLDGWGRGFAQPRLARVPLSPLAFAGSSDPRTFPVLPQAAPRLPPRRRRGRLMRRTVEWAAGSRLLGTTLVFALLGASALYGAVRGGAYASYVAANGQLPDQIARLSGFGIKSVTVAGAKELRSDEILKLARIGAHDSLAFLDAAAVRRHLTAVPLIKDASVSKLFPNRLLIEIEERKPYALWQQNGVVSLVATDGTPIDDMHDKRFETLPLVVGDGANKKLEEYVAILGAAGDLRKRVRAGIYVSQRRWTLKLDSGVEVDLPEFDPESAVTRLASFERDTHVLEKDILSADLRVPGRMTVRLSADAADARLAALAAKAKRKAAGT
jgi:cell division protein FtsQ